MSTTDHRTGTWRPVSPVQLIGARQIAGLGVASSIAYGVTFRLDSRPGATITVWSYVLPGPSDLSGSFVIGFCTEFMIDADSETPRSCCAYTEDPEFYFELGSCDEAAHSCALIAAAAGLDGVPDDVAANFEWDGQPFR